MITLLHYVHCPFCVRVRMGFGLLGVAYNSQVLSYDDVITPENATGKKMLPIMGDGKIFMNESLDILKKMDAKNILRIDQVTTDFSYKEFEGLISTLSNLVHSLAMPYWIWTPEFNESSRKYFQDQKEKKRGPFKDLVKKQSDFISALNEKWPSLKKELIPFYQAEELGLKDIILASHLWGLYVVPEFQFPEEIHHYLQSVKEKCQFDYHQDYWR